MPTRTILSVVSILCFVLSAGRPAIADNVQATAYTWGWGCSLDSHTQQGSITATASANCVDTYGAGAESSAFALVTRDPKTALDASITVVALSSSNNWDNTWTGATGSWNESVLAVGGTGQGLLWLDYEVSGSFYWSSYSFIAEACLTTTDVYYCFPSPLEVVDIIPFTFGQSFGLAASLDAQVVASYYSAGATLELGPPGYWFTDLSGNSIPGSLDLTPEPATLLLLGTGLLVLGASVARTRFGGPWL